MNILGEPPFDEAKVAIEQYARLHEISVEDMEKDSDLDWEWAFSRTLSDAIVVGAIVHTGHKINDEQRDTRTEVVCCFACADRKFLGMWNWLNGTDPVVAS